LFLIEWVGQTKYKREYVNWLCAPSALGWSSVMIMGFHEYAYQDREYIIKAMNTKHAQCTCYAFS